MRSWSTRSSQPLARNSQRRVLRVGCRCRVHRARYLRRRARAHGCNPEDDRLLRCFGDDAVQEAALALCDEVGDAARVLGSLNTLIPLADGRLRGESTDGAGCVGALRTADRDPSGRHCIVVGAGATARACIVGLAQAGAASIGVVNRTIERAESAAALAPAVARVVDPRDIGDADVIVHTTPAGMGGNTDVAFDPSLVGSRHTVLDAVYQPLETNLLAVARRAGATCVDGLWMLVHQAVEQQRLWTGMTPDPGVMRGAAEHELERRRR